MDCPYRLDTLPTAHAHGRQDFAGYADSRTTLTYIRNRYQLSDSPAYYRRRPGTASSLLKARSMPRHALNVHWD